MKASKPSLKKYINCVKAEKLSKKYAHVGKLFTKSMESTSSQSSFKIELYPSDNQNVEVGVIYLHIVATPLQKFM